MKTTGYAALRAGTTLTPYAFERRATGQHDVAIEILFCGVCHTDLHLLRDEWGTGVFPMVPGHEIVGRVIEVGSAVTKLRVGDHAGVGCMVDSCRTCAACTRDLEQYCEQGVTFTYNSVERGGTANTLGGYAKHIVVDERFVIQVKDGLDLAAAAPLLCAGITTYSPLRRWNAGPSTRVGVVGLGGLGHVAVKLAKAMGAHVTAIELSSAKAADARRLGADDVLLSSDPAALAGQANRFDLLLDTIPVTHDTNPLLSLLRLDGTLVLIGCLSPIAPVVGGNLMAARRSISGTAIGGMAETQEMMDFCAAHGVGCDVERVAMSDLSRVFERLRAGDVRYRFVIDMAR